MFFIENRQDGDDFNQIPDRRAQAKAPFFWNFVASMLGSEPTQYEPENQRVAALRRNAAAYEAQRRPSIASEIIAEAVDHVKALPLVREVIKAASALEVASQWLQERLSSGPIAAKVLERLADDDGIARRTLERARRKLGLKPRRVKGRSVWMLPEHDSAKK